MEIKKVGLFYDGKKPGAFSLAREADRWLSERKIPSVLMEAGASESPLVSQLNLIITFGGDGLILHVADMMAAHNLSIPIVRVNFGTKGFLTNVRPEEIIRRLEDILNGKYIITKRKRMQAFVWVKSEGDGRFNVCADDALNEITLEKTGNKALVFSLIINGEEPLTRRGNGLIFATRTGSTAYNKAAGGKVLADEKDFVATVICPTDEEDSPCFIEPADDSTFEVQLQARSSEEKVRVVADGRTMIEIFFGDQVIIKKSPKSTLFAEFVDE